MPSPIPYEVERRALAFEGRWCLDIGTWGFEAGDLGFTSPDGQSHLVRGLDPTYHTQRVRAYTTTFFL